MLPPIDARKRSSKNGKEKDSRKNRQIKKKTEEEDNEKSTGGRARFEVSFPPGPLNVFYVQYRFTEAKYI